MGRARALAPRSIAWTVATKPVASGIAMTTARAFWSRASFMGFNRFLVRLLNERMARFIATIEYDRIHDPTARVARHIAWLFNSILYPGSGDRIEISQEELALLAGVSRAVANKSLQVLEGQGLLRVARDAIAVVDAQALGRTGTRGTKTGIPVSVL